MKKAVFLLVTAIMAVFLTNCTSVSVSPENVAEGKLFTGYKGDYDSSKPIEEQCILINLTSRRVSRYGVNYTRITKIDGKKWSNFWTSHFIILQSGTHKIDFFCFDEYRRDRKSYTANPSITYNFEAGNIYFVEGSMVGMNVSISIANLSDYESVRVHKSYLGAEEMVMPVPLVIQGIKNAIKSGLK
ncbi:MAG: hypothetical protein FWG13_07885 [Leptospirales bacterium]|nr:hypothetical protein [Leptospirales bacterium]